MDDKRLHGSVFFLLLAYAVYAAWLAVTAVGLAGYVLARRGYRLAGLALIGAYAALGFDSLAHYALAPWSAHTALMNLSIGLEVATAALLLVAAARQASRGRSPG